MRQECIPVGSVPSVAVSVGGGGMGVSAHGGGVGYLWGVSACGMRCTSPL